MRIARRHSRARFLPLAVFLAGAALRMVYAWNTDPRIVNDDHFAVMRIMLDEGRWPEPDEGWQTYQPPLYHALGALTYRLTAGDLPAGEQVLANPRHAAGRKAVQFISTTAGMMTLLMVWLTLRLLYPGRWRLQSLGLSVVAFLPAHITMSVMSTNDAMTYLWSSLCIYAVLRGLIQNSEFKIQKGWWGVAGIAAALAMWTKQYGLGSLVVLVAAVPLGFTVKAPGARQSAVRGAALASLLALALGCWPYLRTWRLAGNPMASNYTLRPHTMDDQFPGRLEDVSFFSFRFGKLLARPWRHLDTVDSFWTQLYARLWFDHDTTMTLYQYGPWFEAMGHIWRDRTLDGRERERRQLLWSTEVVPGGLLWQGRALIALGLVPTGLIVLGVISTWMRPRMDLRRELLMISLAMGLAAPLYQTLRQPFHSSMKAAFILPAIVALGVFGIEGWRRLMTLMAGRWLGTPIVGALALLCSVVAWHVLDMAFVWPNGPNYFPRLIPAY